jgi:hypothetical protein
MINRLLLILALCFAALFLSGTNAFASQFSGTYLYQVCNMDEDEKEYVKGGHAVCQSYISGVIDYHNVLRALKIAPKLNICVPDHVGTFDLQKVVLAYLKLNSQHDSFNASPAVTMALYEVFPCK